MATLGKIGEGQTSYAFEPFKKFIVQWRGTDNEIYSTIFESLDKESKASIEKKDDIWILRFEGNVIHASAVDVFQNAFWDATAEEYQDKIETMQLYFETYYIEINKGNSDVFDYGVKVRVEQDTELRCYRVYFSGYAVLKDGFNLGNIVKQI
jgi:hypothetical protein